MFKIISPKNNVTVFNQDIVEVDESFSPIKEILKKNDCSLYSFVLGDNDNEKVSFADTFQFQVNVKDIGTFHFLFKNEGFRKEDIVSEVSGLKELNVDNVESAKHKVNMLINIVKNYNPLFMVFKESIDTYFFSYELEGITNKLFPVFVVKIEQPEHAYEFSIGEDHNSELANTTDKKQKVTKLSKNRILKEIARYKFSLLLVLVSTILLEVSIPLAILNVYAKNTLYIFLFICGTIGFVMNVYCYFDYFRNRNIKNPLFLCNVASNLIGIGIGVGAFAIFYHISTKTAGTPGLGSFIFMGIIISLIVIAATITIINFIPRKNKGK